MATHQDVVLNLSHRFNAPRDAVFQAWTDTDVLRKWWAASPTWSTPAAEVDLREGGRYRLSMQTDEGDVHTVGGEFKEVSPPERLVYTWAWEEGPQEMEGSEETVVTVEFREDGNGTVVELTHSGFANAEISGKHEHGWAAVMSNLERQVFPG